MALTQCWPSVSSSSTTLAQHQSIIEDSYLLVVVHCLTMPVDTSVWLTVHDIVHPTEHEALTQCWFIVGPASKTVVQHQTSIGSMPRVD